MSDPSPTPMDTTPTTVKTEPDDAPAPSPPAAAAAPEPAAADPPAPAADAPAAAGDDVPMAPAVDDDAAAQAADDARIEADIRAREAQEQVEAAERAERERAEQLAREERERKEAEERATWTETLYINNLNEKVKVPVIKHCLQVLFGSYGPVLSITAHDNLRMRGQAFVAFANKEHAAKALKDIQKFPLYGKPMQISFAKTRSDAVVRKLDADALDAHVEARKEHKKKTRHDNPLAQKNKLKRKLASGEASAADADGAAAAVADGTAEPPAKRAAVMMPEEYLPPNKTLFVQNLMDGVGKDELEDLFGKYANLLAVRVIAARKDIAFVDYADDVSSTAAKEGLNNHRLGPGEGEPMRVTFAR